MSSIIYSLTHGWVGLVFSYVSVLAPTVVGLRHGKASTARLVTSPLLAVLLMLVAGLADLLTQPLLRAWGVGFESPTHVLCEVLLAVMVGYAGGRRVATKERARQDSHRRGAVITSSEPATGAQSAFGGIFGAGASNVPSGEITLAGLPVAPVDETKHFKLVGTTGTGKSTAIREILSLALARGDRVVIADPDGGYLRNFYDAGRGDVILNPFEAGGARWNLFGEITRDYDVEQLARSLIPDGVDDARVWNGYARTFFTALVQQAWAGGIKDDAEIERLVRAPVKELKILLRDTSAGPFLEEGSEKLFGSVRSITSAAIQALKYTASQRGAPFSVRQWVRNGAARSAGGRGGVLFIPYKAGEIAALGSTISAWMRLAIFEALDKPEGDQRLWFVVDELDALGEIDGLKDALTRLRKFGGRCVLGFQSIAQVSGTYGKSAADTIVENCGNTVILRCSASEHGGTSEFASKLIGQREVVQNTQSRTRQPGHWRSSTTSSQQIKIEPAVMASEIERLPDLVGFAKFASNPDWLRVELTPVEYPVVVRAVPASEEVGGVAPEVRSGSETEPSAAGVGSLSTVAPEESLRASAKAGSPARRRAKKTATVKPSANAVRTDVQPDDGARAAP